MEGYMQVLLSSQAQDEDGLETNMQLPMISMYHNLLLRKT